MGTLGNERREVTTSRSCGEDGSSLLRVSIFKFLAIISVCFRASVPSFLPQGCEELWAG